MAGETDEADLALFLGFAKGFGGAIGADEQFGIVVKAYAMNLPEIEVVGLQAAEGLLQHLHGEGSVAAVSADFGHEEDFVAIAFEGVAHPDFGFAAVIFPAVIEEGYAAVDGFVNDLGGHLSIFSVAEMVSTETQSGDFLIVATKLAHGNGAGGGFGGGVLGFQGRSGHIQLFLSWKLSSRDFSGASCTCTTFVNGRSTSIVLCAGGNHNAGKAVAGLREKILEDATQRKVGTGVANRRAMSGTRVTGRARFRFGTTGASLSKWHKRQRTSQGEMFLCSGLRR